MLDLSFQNGHCTRRAKTLYRVQDYCTKHASQGWGILAGLEVQGMLSSAVCTGNWVLPVASEVLGEGWHRTQCHLCHRGFILLLLSAENVWTLPLHTLMCGRLVQCNSRADSFRQEQSLLLPLASWEKNFRTPFQKWFSRADCLCMQGILDTSQTPQLQWFA